MSVLVFLCYPALELASNGLEVVEMACTAGATAVVVVLYLWAVWHRRAGWSKVWPALGAMAAVGIGVPVAWGPEWIGLLLFVAVGWAVVLPSRVALLRSVVVAGLLAGEGFALGGGSGLLISLGLVTLLGGLAAAGYVRVVGVNHRLAVAQAEVARLAAAAERAQLGRDLHDAVKQELFVASMEIATARAALESRADDVRAHMDEAARAVIQAQGELSGLIRRSRPPAGRGGGLASDLRSFLAESSARYGIEAALDASDVGSLPAAVGEALLWSAREAVTNVARHAHARVVQVSLTGDGHGVELRVADDGSGFDADCPGAGHGLAIMAERLEAVEASVSVHSRPGEGTQLVVRWTAPQRGLARP